jgi:hypothetical protein
MDGMTMQDENSYPRVHAGGGMNPSGIEQLLTRNKTILPRSLQEICDLYHFDELAVQIISAENRYESWKSSGSAIREVETS